MCLAGALVVSWSLTQVLAGWNPLIVITNIFVTEFAEFTDTFWRYRRHLHLTISMGFTITIEHFSKIFELLIRIIYQESIHVTEARHNPNPEIYLQMKC